MVSLILCRPFGAWDGGGIGYRGLAPPAKFCRPCRAVEAMTAEGGIIYEIYKIPRAERAGVLEHHAAGETKKGSH